MISRALMALVIIAALFVAITGDFAILTILFETARGAL